MLPTDGKEARRATERETRRRRARGARRCGQESGSHCSSLVTLVSSFCNSYGKHVEVFSGSGPQSAIYREQ